MANPSMGLDKWRDYFRGANSDIFNIIEHAIMVAASDCPYDFKVKRNRIAEMLFTCKVTKCFGCDRIELAVPDVDGGEKSSQEDDEDKCKSKDTKGSKVNSSGGDDDDDCNREVMEMNVNQISNHSYDEAEALTDEIEVELQFFEEVVRIKKIIDKSEEESDESVFDLLRRLQLMRISVEVLKVTEIGKSVNSLRKHRSKEIRNLVRTLIEEWKNIVDAWVDARAAISGAEVTTECGKTSASEEEEGLPSPPMDEGALFTTPTSMELSKIFDDMDDDGNPQNSGEFIKNRENGRERRIETDPTVRRIPQNQRNQESVLKKKAPHRKPNRPINSESGPGRPEPPSRETGNVRAKPPLQPKINHENEVQEKSDKGAMQKKLAPHQQEKSNCNNEASVRTKLEAAKRKLQERYQEAENAKKQRTIQVVELNDLPKQSLPQKNQQSRAGNRQWGAQGRR